MSRDVSTDNVSAAGDATTSPSQRSVSDAHNLFTIVAPVIFQATLLTGFLYYIGWARTHSFFGYFGVDTSLVDFSTPDFVLRGGSDVLRALWIYIARGAAPALGLFAIHRLVMIPALVRATQRDPSAPSKVAANELSIQSPSSGDWSRLVRQARMLYRWRPGASFIRWSIRILQGLAIMLAATMLAAIVFDKFGTLLGIKLPLLLALSFILLGYVAQMRSTYSDVLTATMASPVPSQHRIYPLVLLTLGLLAGVWATSLYGDRLGREQATAIAANPDLLSEVQVDSTDRIALNGHGVTVSEIAQLGSKYRYQYTGLRLLASPPSRFLLLPSKWQKGRDRVFVLNDDNSVRVDIFAR